MSVSDVQFRTDQHNAQQRQFYDAQRYHAQQGMGQSIERGGQNLAANHQFNQQMQLQRAQFEMNAKMADAGLRLQAAEMEQQMHRNKLNTMLAINQVDQAKAQTSILEQQAKAARMANDRAERMNAQMDKYQVDELPLDVALRTNGRVLVGDKGIEFFGGGSDAKTEKRLQEDSMRRTLEVLAKRYRNSISGEVEYDPETKAFAGFLESQLRNSMGGKEFDAYKAKQNGQAGQPQPPAPQPPAGAGPGKPPQTESGLPPQVEQMTGHVYGAVQRDPMWAPFVASLKPEFQSRVMATVATYAADIAARPDMSYPPEMAPVLVFQAFDQDPYVAAHILRSGGFAPEDISNLLTARGLNQKTIDRILGGLQAYIDNLKKRSK